MARAWLRLGRVAAIGVIAALSIAGGTLFPQAQTAAAQGVHSGYTYTQRVCQELGQQPRHYQVRDEMAGSDWRSDGGWAIVLIRGAVFRPAHYTFGAAQGQGGAASRQIALNTANTFLTGNAIRAYGLRTRDVITDNYGNRGFVMNFGRDVMIDRNRDGQITTADMAIGLPNHPYNLWGFERRQYTLIPAVSYGTQYIRWANMLWCR